jgi:hypothetical protein
MNDKVRTYRSKRNFRKTKEPAESMTGTAGDDASSSTLSRLAP